MSSSTEKSVELPAEVQSEIDMATARARTVVVIGAAASFIFSVSLWFSGMKEEGLFVGLWVPSILSLGNLLLPSNR